MFQTEPILYLQSLSSDVLTFLMLAITSTVQGPFLICLMLFITLGVSLRKGFLLLQLVFWTLLVNNVLKLTEGLPRPYHVDSRVLDLVNGKPNLSPYIGMDARGFFEPLPPEIVAHFRSLLKAGEFGFPSGHVQTATVLWAGISILFENRIVRWITPLMIVLMAVSRMYLGVHFLADVIGGAAFGVIILFVAYQLHLRWPLLDRVFERFRLSFSTKRTTKILSLSIMLLAPLLLAPASAIEGNIAGYLLGINTGFLLLMAKGLPDAPGTLPARAARGVIGVLLFIVIQRVVDTGFSRLGLHSVLMDELIEVVRAAIPSFIALWGTITLSFRLGWDKCESIADGPDNPKDMEKAEGIDKVL